MKRDTRTPNDVQYNQKYFNDDRMRRFSENLSEKRVIGQVCDVTDDVTLLLTPLCNGVNVGCLTASPGCNGVLGSNFTNFFENLVHVDYL